MYSFEYKKCRAVRGMAEKKKELITELAQAEFNLRGALIRRTGEPYVFNDPEVMKATKEIEELSKQLDEIVRRK